MRFQLSLEPTSSNRCIPINYQYEFSSWIYKTIHFGNPEFANWLHDQGYMDGYKQFKLFTFSKLHSGKINVRGDRLEVLSSPATIQISFYMQNAAEPFIIGLFKNQEFSIGDKVSKVQFRVNTIEKLPEPEWKPTMTFRADSPIIISTIRPDKSKNAQYLSPDDPEYGDLFTKNLLTKYMALMKQDMDRSRIIHLNNKDLKFELLGQPKSKLIKIKAGTQEETLLKGYLFDFQLSAPVELMKLGYYAGFGEKNGLGFGSCEIRK